jgi:hypothetical protein
MYAFAPEKIPSLVGRNFCLAILCVFAKTSIFGQYFLFFPGRIDLAFIGEMT